MPESILDLQVASDTAGIPSKQDLERWIHETFKYLKIDAQYLTLRIVDVDEIQALNRDYRQQDKVTNVLSFPFDPIEDIEQSFLGDVIVCGSVVEQEALNQGKSVVAHWAHMVIHGTLHLCGFDHVTESEADVMEAVEVTLLSGLGYADPYQGDEK